MQKHKIEFDGSVPKRRDCRVDWMFFFQVCEVWLFVEFGKNDAFLLVYRLADTARAAEGKGAARTQEGPVHPGEALQADRQRVRWPRDRHKNGKIQRRKLNQKVIIKVPLKSLTYRANYKDARNICGFPDGPTAEKEN